MKKLISFAAIAASLAVALCQQSPTSITGVTTSTALPTAQAAPLIQNAVIPNGVITANQQAGTVTIRGMAYIVLPVSSITNLATVPAGYDPTNFAGGNFSFNQASGLVQVNASWNLPPQSTNSP